MKGIRLFFAVAAAMALCGCSSYQAARIRAPEALKSVTIVRDRRMVASGMLPLLEDEFKGRGIAVRTVAGPYRPQPGEYMVSCKTRRPCDFIYYLKDAELRIDCNGRPVGIGSFHVSSWAFAGKWSSDRAKMRPLFCAMFGETYPDMPEVAPIAY